MHEAWGEEEEALVLPHVVLAAAAHLATRVGTRSGKGWHGLARVARGWQGVGKG